MNNTCPTELPKIKYECYDGYIYNHIYDYEKTKIYASMIDYANKLDKLKCIIKKTRAELKKRSYRKLY